MTVYELWTDGSCDNGNGIGGWAYAIVKQPSNELVRQDSKGSDCTTNNRMEMQAVIEGLREFNPKADINVVVVSDSAYVVNCFLQSWWYSWSQNGWRNSSGDEVKNKDLWQELLALVQPYGNKLTWRHVRGHQKKGTLPYNDLVDKLAGEARLSWLNNK